jgi:hypothetical protein
MIIEANCRFCKVPLKLEFNDAYAELGDPMGIIKFAACNPCADYRVGRRIPIKTIKAACYQLILNQDRPKKELEEIQERIRTVLVKATRSYAESLCDFYRSRILIFDESLADGMIAKPKDWGDLLRGYHRVAVKSIRQSEAAGTSAKAPCRDD